MYEFFEAESKAVNILMIFFIFRLVFGKTMHPSILNFGKR